MMPHRKNALAAALLLALAACDRQPVGQALAVVDGDEITRAELAAELRAGGDQGPDAARAALNRLIERRLLARAARAEGVDRSQDYLIRSRQLNDALLGELLREQVSRAQPAPDAQAVAAFIRARPAQFAGRMLYAVDAIRTAAPLPAAPLPAELAAPASLDAAARALDAAGIAWSRGMETLDSSALPPAVAERLQNGGRAPVAFAAGDGALIVAVVGRRPQPLVGDAASDLATRMLTAAELDQAVQQRLAAARARSGIAIQPGFAPDLVKAGNGPKE